LREKQNNGMNWEVHNMPYVELVKGVKHDSKFGVHKRGARFICDDKRALAYFKTNGRYVVIEDTRAETRARAAVASPSRRAAERVPPVTPERQIALAKGRVDEGANKEKLLQLAKNLGVELGPNPSALFKRDLIGKIKARQQEILDENPEPDAPEEEEEEDADPDDDEGGEEEEEEEEE
jgi:hypothetical protein